MIIGTVVEGPTDRLVLEAVISRLLPGDHRFLPLQPQIHLRARRGPGGRGSDVGAGKRGRVKAPAWSGSSQPLRRRLTCWSSMWTPILPRKTISKRGIRNRSNPWRSHARRPPRPLPVWRRSSAAGCNASHSRPRWCWRSRRRRWRTGHLPRCFPATHYALRLTTNAPNAGPIAFATS